MRILNSRRFYDADHESFAISLQILKDNGYYVDPSRSKALQLVTSYDKVIWKASDRALAAHTGPLKSIDARNVIHQAMNALVGHKHGWSYKKKPQLTLLSEALSTATEIYYELCYCSKKGDFKSSHLIPVYSQNADFLKMDFLNIFNNGLADPFGEYKQTVIELFEISKILLNAKLSNLQGREISFAKLHNSLRKFPRWPFYRQKDFGNWIMFVLVECGPKSDRTDLKIAEVLLQNLKNSKSMPSFMKSLKDI